MTSITTIETDRTAAIAALERRWTEEAQELAVRRDYTAADVLRLRALFQERPYLHTFGALSGAQAVQMVRAGLDAIYLSGWQVAADANLAGQTYPDQSLYPVNSAPALVRRINNALQSADQVERAEGRHSRDWFAPIVADAEAGFGGPLHAFELTKAMIEAGAAEAGREIGRSSYYTTALTTMVVLDPGEAVDSPRVKAECGAMAMAAVHFSYDQFRNFGRRPPGFMAAIWDDYRALIESYPVDRRHQRIHGGHNCWVLPEEEEFLTPDILQASAMIGTRDDLIERLSVLGASDLDQVMILPNFDTRFDVLERVAADIIPNV